VTKAISLDPARETKTRERERLSSRKLTLFLHADLWHWPCPPRGRDNETPLLVFESIRKSAAPESRAPKGRAWYRASDGDDRHGDPDVPHDRLRRPRHERDADRQQPDGERPGARGVLLLDASYNLPSPVPAPYDGSTVVLNDPVLGSPIGSFKVKVVKCP